MVALVVHVPAGPHGGAGAPAEFALRTCALGRHPPTSPCLRHRTFRLPVAPTRANVDGRRLPAAATTRRTRVHDPARDRLDHHPGDARAAPPPCTFGPQGPTLGDLIDAYLQDYQVRQFRSVSTARGRTAHLAAFFGRAARAAALTTYQIRQYQLARRAAGRPPAPSTGRPRPSTAWAPSLSTGAGLDTVPASPTACARIPPPGLLRAPRIPRRPRSPARPVAGHPRPRLLLRVAQE